MFRRLKLLFQKDEFVPVRSFNFKKAEEVLFKYRKDLLDMSLCMGYDDDVWEDIIIDGNLIVSPLFLSNVAGVTVTTIDVPCIYLKLRSGVEGKLCCYKEHKYNKTKKRHCYGAFGGVPFEKECFESFCPDLYTNGLNVIMDAMTKND